MSNSKKSEKNGYLKGTIWIVLKRTIQIAGSLTPVARSSFGDKECRLAARPVVREERILGRKEVEEERGAGACEVFH